MSQSPSRQAETKPAHVRVSKIGAALGAEVAGVDLRRDLTDAEFEAVEAALVEHQVLVFRDQEITQDQQIRFGERFGELTVHPFGAALKDRPVMIVLDNDKDAPPNSTDQWHSDEMFQLEPPKATLLLTRILPPYGGNTLFASMTAAYEGLSNSMQQFISGLEAEADFKVFRKVFSKGKERRRQLAQIEEMFPSPVHPVVRVHPVSRKKAVYVSPQATTRICGMSEWESTRVLEMLYQLPQIPEYQLRVEWRPNTVVIWDNRSTQHYAPRDYLPHRRRMERVTIKGDRPIGVSGKRSYTVAEAPAPAEDRTKIKTDELVRPFERMLPKSPEAK